MESFARRGIERASAPESFVGPLAILSSAPRIAVLIPCFYEAASIATAAAKLLGMSFRALRYRVKKLGIE